MISVIEPVSAVFLGLAEGCSVDFVCCFCRFPVCLQSRGFSGDFLFDALGNRELLFCDISYFNRIFQGRRFVCRADGFSGDSVFTLVSLVYAHPSSA